MHSYTLPRNFEAFSMAVPINYNRVGDLAEFIQVLEVVETIE